MSALDRDKVIVKNAKYMNFIKRGMIFAIVGPGTSEICRANWQAEDPGRS